MNILQAKETIKQTIAAYLQKDAHGQYMIPVSAQRPILLMGPPGIGKTAVMEQIARECHVGLVAYTMTHHTRQSAVGLPMIENHEYAGREYKATEYTMSEIVASVYEAMNNTKKREGILFLDEINCVSETLSPTMLQLLQKKMFGNHSIPEGWIIVAAGNPPEYNKSVREFDIVTLDRVRKIDIKEDFGVWKAYAYERGVHPAVMTYLEIKKDQFYKIETAAGGKRFVTARGWEDLSFILKVNELLHLIIDEALIGQYIQHPQTARDFANYYDLYHQYKDDYRIDEIFDGRISEAAIEKIRGARFDEKVSLIGLLMGVLNNCFVEWQAQNEQISAVHECLLRLKAAADMQTALDMMISELDEKEDAVLLADLETYRKILLSGGSFEQIRGHFLAQVDTLAHKNDEGVHLLEAAFDFLEKAFGESQEMVMFITEMNTNPHALRFIRENGSDRYYKYNQGLLFNSGYEAMLKEVDAAVPLMDFMGL